MAYFKIESVNDRQLRSELKRVDNGDEKIYLFELNKIDKIKISEKALEEYNIMNKILKASEAVEKAY